MSVALLLAVLLTGCTASKPDAEAEVPAPAEPCPAAGGRCEAVGACGVGAGLLNGASCGAPHLVCCLPLSACPPEDFACSNGSYGARPSCEGGSLVCAEGFTRVALGACASPQR